MKVSELIGEPLDWAVAKSLGGKIRTENGVFLNQGRGYEYFTPSANKSQAERIIRRLIRAGLLLRKTGARGSLSLASPDRLAATDSGCISTIEALRFFVASKLGDEVEVPEALL